MTTELIKSHRRGLPLPHEYAAHVERVTSRTQDRRRKLLVAAFCASLLTLLILSIFSL